MSTSSASNVFPDTVIQNQHAEDRRHAGTHDAKARRRTQSAPAMLHLRVHHAPPSLPTDDQLDALLRELNPAAIGTDTRTQERRHSADATEHGNDVDHGLADIDRIIDELFQSTLHEAMSATDTESREHSLTLAVGMLPNMDPAVRTAARLQILAAISDGTPSIAVERLLRTLIDDFAAAHRQTDKAQASRAAQDFVESLSYAMAHVTVRAKCTLLVHQLWAARTLDCFTMAKVAVDLFGEAIAAKDPETAAGNIAKAASCIDAMPIRYNLMFATKLYQCAPDASPWKIHSLQTIANKNMHFSDNAEAQRFCKILNQEIYELRLDAADEL